MRIAAVLGERNAMVWHRKPLFTPYSVFTLQTNALFSHLKATRHFGYRPRPFRQTIQSTLRSLGFKKKLYGKI